MRANIVQIGNSRGIRIPKVLIEQAGLMGEVEISVRKNSLVITPTRKPRAGWPAAFKAISERGDDALLDAPSLRTSDWDEVEWVWP